MKYFFFLLIIFILIVGCTPYPDEIKDMLKECKQSGTPIIIANACTSGVASEAYKIDPELGKAICEKEIIKIGSGKIAELMHKQDIGICKTVMKDYKK